MLTNFHTPTSNITGMREEKVGITCATYVVLSVWRKTGHFEWLSIVVHMSYRALIDKSIAEVFSLAGTLHHLRHQTVAPHYFKHAVGRVPYKPLAH